MNALSFPDWWHKFYEDHRSDKDGGYDAVAELVRYVRALEAETRADFISGLFDVISSDGPGWGIAVAALQDEATPDEVRRLLRILPIQSCEAPNDSSLEVLRLVARRDPKGPGRPFLEAVLRNAELSPLWAGLPWSLWPHEPDLFTTAWCRYFTQVDPARWRGTVIPQAFLSRPLAVAALREQLESQNPSAWQSLRLALTEQVDASWLDPDAKRSLAALLS